MVCVEGTTDSTSEYCSHHQRIAILTWETPGGVKQEKLIQNLTYINAFQVNTVAKDDVYEIVCKVEHNT